MVRVLPLANSKKGDRMNSLGTKILLGIGLLTILIICPAVPIGIYFLCGNLKEASQWGNIFTASSALFSALAFYGMLVTIYIQLKDINRAQCEIRESINGNAIAAMLAALPELIKEQRFLLEGLDGSLKGRLYLTTPINWLF